MYDIVGPTGVVHSPPKGRCWSTIEEEFLRLKKAGRIWFGKEGRSQPNIIRYLSEVPGVVPWTWWPSEEVGHTDEGRKESNRIFGSLTAFDTQKPERLICRIIEIASNPGDLVLDSFIGSGTTAAVAQKMMRRWIGVELGDHAETHIVPRLRKVIDGDDPGGITESTNWKGGGGFRFYRLAPSLLERDQWDNWVVNKAYNPEMLAEAMCNLEGFRYEPDQETFWLHGRSTERDFLYVTTQNLSRSQLAFLSEQVGPDRTLLICCGAFRAPRDAFDNLTIKKIPQAVLHRCEWGHDDYSLNVENLPVMEEAEELLAAAPPSVGSSKRSARKKKTPSVQELPLFALLEDDSEEVAPASEGDQE